MSGPKTGHIALTPSALFDQQCSGWESWLRTKGEVPSLEEIEAELTAARNEARSLRQSPTPPPAALLTAADEHREQLSLFVNRRRAQWTSAAKTVSHFRATLYAQRQMVSNHRTPSDWNRSISLIQEGGNEAQTILKALNQEMRQIGVIRRELQLVRKKLTAAASHSLSTGGSKRGTKATPAASSQEIDLKEIRRNALAAEVEKRLGNLTDTQAADEAKIRDWVVASTNWTDYAKLLAQTRGHLTAGLVSEAEQNVAAAEIELQRMQKEATNNREAAARNEQVAEAIMQALCDRNYNTPNFGDLKAGNRLGGIQIRADVPNRDGKGNLRIDIHLDGRTVFEVENVAEGEESICKDVINGVGDAIAGAGLVLEMKDWGRATKEKARPNTISVPQDKQREPEREGNRGA